MIALWNRRELTVTQSLQRQAEIREALSAANIKYHLRIVSMDPHSRTRTGMLGLNADYLMEYLFYVHKNDYERAQFLIR